MRHPIALILAAALASTFVPTSTFAQPQRIAVLEFDGDGSIEARKLQFLADKVREAALKQLGPTGWEVVTRENMLVLLEANAVDLAQCVGECDVETGRLLGAHQVVAGSQVEFGSTYELVLRSYDTQSGRLLASESVSASGMDDLRDKLGPAVAKLFGGGVARVSGANAGNVDIGVDAGMDVGAAVAEAERLRKEREALEQQEREVQPRLAEDRQRRRGEAEAQLLATAEADWVAMAPLLETPGPETTAVVELFLSKYGEASVTVDGETRAVEIAQVGEARQWSERFASVVTSGGGDLGGSVIDQYRYAMVRIEAGEFWMGSPADEDGRGGDETRHKVRLTGAFAMGATEVTQDLYESVMGENPSQSEYKGVSLLGPKKPVQKVSWTDAVRFCNALSEREGLEPAYRISGDTVSWDHSSNGYRFPTEAEWEYAARAGTAGRYAGTDAPSSVCRYGNVSNPLAKQQFEWIREVFGCEDGQKVASDAGVYQSNAWDLYDMTGNVREWVWDRYGSYPSGTVTDPMGSDTGSGRVTRGGSWYSEPRGVRVADRGRYVPGLRHYYIGLRLARDAP